MVDNLEEEHMRRDVFTTHVDQSKGSNNTNTADDLTISRTPSLCKTRQKAKYKLKKAQEKAVGAKEDSDKKPKSPSLKETEPAAEASAHAPKRRGPRKKKEVI